MKATTQLSVTLFIFLVAIPFTLQAATRSIHPYKHWERTTTETVWEGMYANCDYGYYVALPDHLVAHSPQSPAPSHGFAIDLEHPAGKSPLPDHMDRYIKMWNQYNAEELPSLSAIVRDELKRLRGSRNRFTLIDRSYVRLGSLPAMELKFSYIADGHLRAETRIIAYRPPGRTGLGDIIYELSLVTVPSKYRSDSLALRKTVSGFHLTPLRLRGCANSE